MSCFTIHKRGYVARYLNAKGRQRDRARGTTILDLMKDDLERPTVLLDITHGGYDP